jgi:hypothetical protein
VDAFERLRQYQQLADALAGAATREQLVDCAKFLALNLAQYQTRYGVLPMTGSWDFLGTDEMSEAQAAHVSAGLENFVGMLGNIMQGLDDNSPETVQ